MNRQRVPGWTGGVKHAPVTGPELEQTRERAYQRLRLDLIEMLGEPLDLFGYASGNRGIKLGKVLKRLRG